MRHGILFDNNRHKLPLHDAVKSAVRQFTQATHLRGLYPAELHFPPAELPAALEIDGLSVLPDAFVRDGCIRVTTYDIAPDAEWEMTRRQLARETRQAAAL